MKQVAREGNLRIKSILTVKDKGSTKTIGGKTIRCGYTVGFVLENISNETIMLKGKQIVPHERAVISLIELENVSKEDTDTFNKVVNGILIRASGRRPTFKLFPKQYAEVINIAHTIEPGVWALNNEWLSNTQIVNTVRKFHKNIQIGGSNI